MKMRYDAHQLYTLLNIWNPQTHSQVFTTKIRIMVHTEEPFSHMFFVCGSG